MSRYLLGLAFTLVVGSGVAVAQEPVEDDPPTSGDPSASSSESAGDVAAAPAPPAAAKPYPVRRLDRPRTIPAGAYFGEARFWGSMGTKDPMGNSNNFKTIGNTINAAYAPVNDIETRLGYSYALVEPDGVDTGFRGTMTLAVRHFTVKMPPNFWMAVQIDVPLDFQEDAQNAMGMDIDNHAVFNRVVLSPPMKYKVNDQFGMFIGDNLITASFAPEVRTTNLQINLPVSAMYQANDNIAIELWTNVLPGTGIALLTPDESVADGFTSIAEVSPLELRAWYSPSSALDVGLTFGSGDLQRENLLTGDSEIAWTTLFALGYRGGI